MRYRNTWVLVAVACVSSLAARQTAPPMRPAPGQPGPWDNDVLVYRVAASGQAAPLATFERAGVPTLARLKDGRLVAAHQHFPADNDADFDKVAVRFSSDEGQSWTPPQVIRVSGLDEGLRFPFDPTLVPLPDGRVRLYFTSRQQRGPDLPAIYSAISTDAVAFVVEPGVRFRIDGRPVIDCAVALHAGVFHLFAPDNGTLQAPQPGQPPPRIGEADSRPGEGRPQIGAGYHAISRDGLTFERVADVHIDGQRRWLGNAQSDGTTMTFFGTGDAGGFGPGAPGVAPPAGGVWIGTSRDGTSWQVTAAARVMGADPGGVAARDGGWMLAVTGPPRAGTPAARGRAQLAPGQVPPVPGYNIRSFGARGDGVAVDSEAINNAILAASAAGGGTVDVPAGRYLSFSIRLRSHVTLRFSPGAVLIAGDPASGLGQYDLPEKNASDQYQDFGHSHWQNSLISGIDVEDVAIVGPGLIDGRGLTRAGPGAPWVKRAGGDRPLSMGAAVGGPGDPETAVRRMDGLGNKAIALKRSRNVTLRDVSILNGGHFALLATGVDNLTIDNVKVDTNRDGFDIDSCRNVRISNVTVNSPSDDAIVLKSSFALGELRATENVTITNCLVSGYDVGTVLDGTFKRTQERAPDRDGVTGRIKLGTESNGGFRNITISNCVFDRSRGLAIETVDGGVVEDVTVTNLTMRDVTTAPIFLRIGTRGRGPDGTPVGRMRRIHISHVVADNIEPRFAASIVGIPGSAVEDVTLSDIRLIYRGGGTAADAARDVPEVEDAYPEPSMFGTLPAYGVYVRHASGVTLRDVIVSTMAADARPALFLEDVRGISIDHMQSSHAGPAPFAILRDVRDLALRNVTGVTDVNIARIERSTMPYR